MLALGRRASASHYNLKSFSPMLKLDFFAAVERILEGDSKFDRSAYHFLKESLELITGDGKKKQAESGGACYCPSTIRRST